MVQTLNFINLSSQQAPNDVDWAGLVNSGVQGVLIRLGHGIIRDPCASGHIAKAKQYGLYWHGYHTYEGVVNESQFTIKNANELGLSTSQYYFVDLTKSSDPFNDYYALHANWLSQGYSTGLLISSNDYLSKFTDSDVTASGTLRWLISDTEPDNYDIWQYSSEGTIGTSSVKVGFNFAKTDKLKYNLNTTLTGADISKDPYNPQAPVGGAYIGWGYDTTGLGGGKTIGYSTNGKNFYALIGPDGLVVRKSDGNRIYGTIADQIDSAISANVIPAKSAADSAVAYANDAIKKSKVNSQAIDDINSAVSDAVSDAAVARSDGLRAWNAAQSNVNLIDLNYASASAAISSARTEAIAAADEAKTSASAAQAGVVAVRSDVAVQAKSLSSYAAQASANGADIVTLKSQAGQVEQDMASVKGDVSQLKVSASSASVALSDATGNISSLQATAKSYSAALSDTNSNVASVTATASDLETKYADAAGDINTLKANASGFSQTLVSAKGDISTLQETANGLKNTLTDAQGNISTLQSDVSGLKKTTSDNAGNISSLQATAQTLTNQMSGAQGDISTLKQTASDFSSKVSCMETSLSDANSKITANTTAIEQNKQAIALKADQTTVDKTNGTVQQLQSQLKVQADQIASKVSSSDLDAKGYATQTYTQTQIKQTSDSWNANLASVKDGLMQSYTNLHATVDGIQAQVYNSDGSSKITQLSNLIATKVSSDDFNNLSQSVNLQTLDSADISTMKTNGHYFVHNLANNPIGGWVYVDVTGNGNDRIRQDVYQDTGIKHKYRRLFGTSWTGWEEGATESEITLLSNAINLRVSKGDVVSQINEEAGGNTLIQVSNGKGSLILNADNTIITGKAWIPDAAIGSISADKVMLGSSSLYNSDGTLNLVNTNDGTTSKITVSQGNVNFDGVNKNASIIKFASDNNTNAFTVNPTGATVTPTLFFERFDQTVGHWLGFTRNEVEHEGVTFHTWDDEAERFFISCHARFDKNLRTIGTLSQGSWDGTTAKPEAGILTIKSGNTIWSGSDFLAVGSNVTGTYTGVWAKAFVQQSTLSAKTNIETVDPKYALDLVNKTDIRSYQYKSDVAQGYNKRYTSLIIDDVNDVSKYYAPNEFTNEERTGRDDGSAVGYLFLAVKELTRRIKTLEEKLNG